MAEKIERIKERLAKSPYYDFLMEMAKVFYAFEHTTDPSSSNAIVKAVDACDKIIRIDMKGEKGSADRLNVILGFAVHDSFWKHNVLSLEQLRLKRDGVRKWEKVESALKKTLAAGGKDWPLYIPPYARYEKPEIGSSLDKNTEIPGSTVKKDLVDARKTTMKALREVAYSEYLQTPEWAEKRDAAILRAGGRCQVCNDDRQLNVHHRTYERVEDDAPEDLVVLCRRCHELFHFGKVDMEQDSRKPDVFEKDGLPFTFAEVEQFGFAILHDISDLFGRKF